MPFCKIQLTQEYVLALVRTDLVESHRKDGVFLGDGECSCDCRNPECSRTVWEEGLWWIDCTGPPGMHLGNYLLSNYQVLSGGSVALKSR